MLFLLLLRAVHRVPQQFARTVQMSYRCGWHIFGRGYYDLFFFVYMYILCSHQLNPILLFFFLYIFTLSTSVGCFPFDHQPSRWRSDLSYKIPYPSCYFYVLFRSIVDGQDYRGIKSLLLPCLPRMHNSYYFMSVNLGLVIGCMTRDSFSHNAKGTPKYGCNRFVVA